MLLSHAGIQDRFVGIVSAEDVKRAKPDPEIFQKARQLLGIEAPKTLIFEDSFHGVSAAHSAGIPVIMVPIYCNQLKLSKRKHYMSWRVYIKRHII